MLPFATYFITDRETKYSVDSESRGDRANVTILPKRQDDMFTLVTHGLLLGKA